MIGVDGQYIFKFKIGDIDDFIREEDLEIFKIIEEAGNALPTFTLHFLTDSELVLSQLHEGNDLQVSFGPSLNDLTDAKLVVTTMGPTRSGDSKRHVSVNGMYSALKYLSADKMSMTAKMSGIEALKSVVSKHFSTQGTFNVQASNDKQNWVQSNIPDRLFVNECWMHSDIPNSFLACGISMDGKFILKDIKADLKTPFKWRFTNDGNEVNDVAYHGDFGINVDHGFVNNWVGYPREKPIYNLVTGETTTISEQAKPIVALTQEIAKRAEIEKRHAVAGVINDNVHPNFWQAYLRNVINLVSFGAVDLVLSYDGQYIPMRVLDQVMFKEDSIANQKVESAEFHSGIYYINRIARTLQNRQFVTTVVISRESLNQVKGDFLPKPVVVPPTLPQAPVDPLAALKAELKSKFPGKIPGL